MPAGARSVAGPRLEVVALVRLLLLVVVLGGLRSAMVVHLGQPFGRRLVDGLAQLAELTAAANEPAPADRDHLERDQHRERTECAGDEEATVVGLDFEA